MSLRCLNCGATGLSDTSELCEVCGEKIIVRLDDSIPMFDELETHNAGDENPEQAVDDFLSDFEADDGDTGPLPDQTQEPHSQPGYQEDVPTRSPDPEPTSKTPPKTQGVITLERGGQTIQIPKAKLFAEEGATSALTFESEEERTAFLPQTPPLPDPDEDSTAFLSEPEPISIDDGATGPLLTPDDGDTAYLQSPPIANLDEGMTGGIPVGEEEHTAFLTQEPIHIPDEENTAFLNPIDAFEEEDGLTQTLSETVPASRLEQGPTESKTAPTHPEETSMISTGQDETIGDVAEREILDGGTVQLSAPDDEGATRNIPLPKPDEASSSGLTRRVRSRQTKTNPNLKHAVKVQDRYQLTEILGRGGFGAVYLAEDTKLGRRCVVKQMLTVGKSPKEIEMHQVNFEREASLLVELNEPGHPNIPEIYDYFVIDSGNYLVMKYIEGKNLKEVMSSVPDGRLDWQDAVRYTIDVCSALHYMHHRGDEPVMHRDVKPANIQLGDDGRVWVVDFGLAKADPVDTTSVNQSVTQASGSFGFTPLEQWIGQAIPASDIYALGVTLHNLVTGINPLDAFDGQYHIQKIQELHGDLIPLRTVNPELPESLEKIIEQATDADSDQRPTALQLQQQLEAIISGTQILYLYTFRNGQSAETIPELVDLCEQNRREAEEYLSTGAFERWFSLINRNDLAQAASQAIDQGKDRKDALEKFLKLILPNIFRRRLRRVGAQLARGTLQFLIVAVVLLLLLGIGGSYVAGLFIEQTLGSVNWDFYALELDGKNVYDEEFLTETFTNAAGLYFDDISVEVTAPDHMNIQGNWQNFPVHLATNVRMGDKKPRINVTEFNDIPLFIIANNISQGINNGIEESFNRSPIDVSSLIVQDGEIEFEVERSQVAGRPEYGTPTPAPTPTPIPTVTPTPVSETLVVVFNDSDEPVTLELEQLGQTWNIPANDTEVLEIPPNTYNYVIRYQGTDEVAARGERTWNLNTAYRLRLDFLQGEN